MLLLSCTDLSRGYDATPLFEEVSFELHAGERIGFVGPNGAGKTTLLKAILKPELLDTGKVQLHAGARIGTLSQIAEFEPGRTLFQEAKSAFDELLAVQEEFIRVADQMAHATDESERRQLSAKYDRLHELLQTQDGYQLDNRVEEVLSGLGFPAVDYHREILSFSGGQQRRLLLAKILLASPDVMILDEPSNHLDIRTTRWLEDYLVRQPQGMIVVSHDRYFLDKVTNRTLELHQRRINQYPGNYTQYTRLREEKFDRQLKEFEAQKEYIEKQEEYIRRAHYGQLAKQAQSRSKTLDKLERIEKPTKVSGPNIQLGEAVRSGDVVFHVEELAKSFGPKHLFDDLNFDIQRGRRVGILGPNGCGKTTLLRILLGDEAPTAGKVQRGHLVFLGYLDQHLKLLDDEKTLLRSVWPEDDATQTEQKMRDLLGSFGLHGEIVEQQVKFLSGGERSRAALARLTVEGANVLILDEPTNHLDIWACDSLEDAVKNFEGTLICVSHDRYFLNRVADMLIVFDSDLGKPEIVFGNYDTYELLRANREQAAKEAAAKSKKSDTAKPVETVNRPEKVKRKRKFPYRKVAELEADIAACETLITQLEEKLQDGELYKNAAKFQETLDALEAAKTKLPTLYEHWEEANEMNG
jgi:ATP-binding cassette, subfamily F, member 3